MQQSSRDTRSILSRSPLVDRKRIASLLGVVLIALFALLNPTFLRLFPGHEPTMSAPAQSMPVTVGTVTAEQLNLTQANVNASRNFMESAWVANSTTALISISSIDQQGEIVSAVFHLDQTVTSQAQIVKYDFDLATNVPTPGPSGPKINASVTLSSSIYQGWYSQSRTPIYPNKTESVSVANVQGLYANSSPQRSLLFGAAQVTNARANSYGGISRTLFEHELPGYAAGDGVFHHYSIEFDLQSNQTVWIADNSIIATFQLSFVPSNMELIVSANDPGDNAIATLKDVFQTGVSVSQPFTGAVSTATSPQIANLTGALVKISHLQDQVEHLNSQVVNLTSQNSQLQAKSSQWFSQWWSSIIWALLGAGLAALISTAVMRVEARRKSGSVPGTIGAICSACGSQMPSGAAFCGECGNALREIRVSCPECGQQMPPASAYCGDCGTQISGDVSGSVASLKSALDDGEKE